MKDILNLDMKVENKNKSKRWCERWLRTTTESKQKQTKQKREISILSSSKNIILTLISTVFISYLLDLYFKQR